MSLYPQLEAVTTNGQPPDSQTFRLQKIGECETLLRSEIENRSRLLKKFRRVVSGINWSFGGIAAAMGSSGFSLMATGIGIIPGIVLEVFTLGVAPLGIYISSRCSKKATKHDEIRMLAKSKLNTVEDHISKALEDSSIDDVEFKLILDEIAKYHAMKDEIRYKYIKKSEQEKNELIKRGRDRASLIKKLAASESPSP